MQIEVSLGDIGIAFAAVSVATTIIGMFLAWLSENRHKRQETAMDAVSNRLLPFYNLVLKSISRIDLYSTIADSIRYQELRIDPAEFYEKAGDAFVYIQEVESRQLIVNIIQILEGLDLLDENTEPNQYLIILSQVLPLMIKLKNQIEFYIEEYAKVIDIPSLDDETLKGSFRTQLSLAESALKEIIDTINKQGKHE
ncbi:MAG: hypothetical protein ACW98Y_21625 [Candidatus Thorarchaeota archaeon]|jgi:hypothetical protein